MDNEWRFFTAKSLLEIIDQLKFTMVTAAMVRRVALSLPGVEEKSHFTLPDFRVNKRIFASLHTEKHLVMVKLSLIDQSVFCAFDKSIIYPVPGGWGQKGATFIDMKKIKKEMLIDALTAAWINVAPKALGKKHFPGSIP